MEEFLTDQKNFNFAIKCHTYPDKSINDKTRLLWNLYKKQVSCFWIVEEIDFEDDQNDFKCLSKEEQTVIKKILGFFANSDSIINLGISEVLATTIKIREILCMYSFQQAMENIHGECYSIMIDKLIPDQDEKDRLFDSINQDPHIRKITYWGLKWIYGKEQNLDSEPDMELNVEKVKENLDKTVIAMACMEGIVFSGAFAIIYWIRETKCKDKMILKGLMQSNDLIARDEGLHTNSGCAIHSLILNKASEEEAHQIIKEIVEITKDFNNSAIGAELVGLTQKDMNTYTEHIADRLSIMLGYSEIYGSQNPFTFMSNIQLLSLDNFFDGRITSYQKGNIAPYLKKMYGEDFIKAYALPHINHNSRNSQI